MTKGFLEKIALEKKLLIVSNREPYIHRRVGDSVRMEKPAGGLTSAMDDALKALGGMWVAWGSGSADLQAVDKRNCLSVPPEDPAYLLKRVWLHPRLVENYYNGYANQVLWPLCHITLDRVSYRRKFWEAYVRTNRIFAQAVLEEALDYSTIWIHDYHLCLLPKMLREKIPDLTMAHFWHIPWPDWSVFRVCPQAKEILEGLLGNDLIGFQIPLFGKNFLACAQECLDAEVSLDPPAVIYQGRKILVKAFPIGIDYEKFEQLASSRRTTQLINKLKQKYHFPTYLGLGVDRLDYTKALIKRLQAIDLFFEKYRRYRSKVSFFQVAIPTRIQEPYISYKSAVEQFINKINNKYARGDWKPIIYTDQKIDHQDLVAYYRMADFALISSIYDGMNLVAKEYVASQLDENGVLILSELAGAAESLDGAVLVNPYDLEEVAENIKKALRMPGREKKGRMMTLRTQVENENIYTWISDILRELQALSASKGTEEGYLFDHLPDIQDAFKNRPACLFFDYDGTLTPIVETPDQAVMPLEIRSLLLKLKELAHITIISGRGLTDLKKMIDIPGLFYVGNHGAEICDAQAIQITYHSASYQERLAQFLESLESSLAPVPGVLIEAKGITASIHFRRVPDQDLGNFFDLFWKTARDYKDDFLITKGKKVLEIRPLTAWNKGDAVQIILNISCRNSFPLYIGDDLTDEDAYRVLRGKGISINVGGKGRADYFLKNQEEVKVFLGYLETLLKTNESR